MRQRSVSRMICSRRRSKGGHAIRRTRVGVFRGTCWGTVHVYERRRIRGGAQMPPRGVKKGTKRARQYEHIKESQRERGTSEGRAEEVAARTVQKERARSGE